MLWNILLLNNFCIADWNHSLFAQYLFGIISPDILLLLVDLVQVYLQHWLFLSVLVGASVLVTSAVAVLYDIGTLLLRRTVLVTGIVSSRVVSKILVALEKKNRIQSGGL